MQKYSGNCLRLILTAIVYGYVRVSGVIRARILFRLHDDININNPIKFTLWNIAISHNIDICGRRSL